MSKIIDAIKETLLPSIPHLSEDDAKDPRLVAQAVESLKEILEVRLGQRGDKLDQSPTWRDLYNNGTIDVIIKGVVLSNVGTNTELPTTGTVNNSVVPPAPTGLSVNAAYTGIIISWDAPSYSNHSYTEIWRCDSDDIGQAYFLGTATSQVYSDSVGYAETKYYWIRFVSKSGITGVYNATSGESGTTSINIAAVMDDLNEKINHSSLSTTLLGTINTTFNQSSDPTAKPDGRSLVVGDTWYDTSNGNVLKHYNGSAWVLTQDSDIGAALLSASDANDLADSKIRVFYDASEPVESSSNPIDEGDLWIDADYKMWRYDDTSNWLVTQDNDIGAALETAVGAAATADGKVNIFYQNAQPTGGDFGDLWFDTNDGDKAYKCTGHSVAYNSTNFSIPDGYPHAITKAGSSFYVCGQGGDKVYKFNSSYSNTSSWSLGSPDGDTVSSPSGIAYANGYLYLVDSARKKVYRYTTTGTYKDSFAVHSSVSNPSGICWDSAHFWITDVINAKVYKHTLGGSYAGAYFSCQTYPTDVTWDGSHFWVIHLNQDKLHEYTRDGTATGVSYSVTSQDTYPCGLCADGDKLWVTGHQADKAWQYVVTSNYSPLNLATAAYVDTKITEQVGYCEFTATSGGVKNIATAYTNKTDCEAATSGTGTYAWKDEPFAALDNMVSTTAGGLVASAQESMTSVAGLQAQYSVKLDSNGYVAGFGLSSTTSSDTTSGNFSEFYVNADRFAIVHPSNNGVTSPFVVDAGNVYMDTAFIKDASIDVAKIANLTVTTAQVTGTLTADQINAISVTGDQINGGTITGTTITGSRIESSGAYMEDGSIVGAYIQGGVVEGAFILETQTAAATEAGAPHYGYRVGVSDSMTDSGSTSAKAVIKIKPYNWYVTSVPSVTGAMYGNNYYRYRRQNICAGTKPIISARFYWDGFDAGHLHSNATYTFYTCTIRMYVGTSVTSTASYTTSATTDWNGGGAGGTILYKNHSLNVGGFVFTARTGYRTWGAPHWFHGSYSMVADGQWIDFAVAVPSTFNFNTSTASEWGFDITITTSQGTASSTRVVMSDEAENDYI